LLFVAGVGKTLDDHGRQQGVFMSVRPRDPRSRRLVYWPSSLRRVYGHDVQSSILTALSSAEVCDVCGGALGDSDLAFRLGMNMSLARRDAIIADRDSGARDDARGVRVVRVRSICHASCAPAAVVVSDVFDGPVDAETDLIWRTGYLDGDQGLQPFLVIQLSAQFSVVGPSMEESDGAMLFLLDAGATLVTVPGVRPSSLLEGVLVTEASVRATAGDDAAGLGGRLSSHDRISEIGTGSLSTSGDLSFSVRDVHLFDGSLENGETYTREWIRAAFDQRGFVLLMGNGMFLPVEGPMNLESAAASGRLAAGWISLA
jgi:hypothetical protein